MNKELFVNYNQANELNKLGFDEECQAWYVSDEYGLEFGKVVQSDLLNKAVVAPTFSQAFKWFKDKHGINQQITNTYNEWDFYIPISQYNEIPIRESSDNWIYEIAVSKCLDKLIDILKLK